MQERITTHTGKLIIYMLSDITYTRHMSKDLQLTLTN